MDFFKDLEEDLLVYEVFDLAAVVEEVSQIMSVHLWEVLAVLAITQVRGFGTPGDLGFHRTSLRVLIQFLRFNVTVNETVALVVVHFLNVVDESTDAVPVGLIKKEPLENCLLDFDLLGLLEELLVKVSDPWLVLADQCLVDFVLAGCNGGERLTVAFDPYFSRGAHDLQRAILLVEELLIDNGVEIIEEPIYLAIEVVILHHDLAHFRVWFLGRLPLRSFLFLILIE